MKCNFNMFIEADNVNSAIKSLHNIIRNTTQDKQVRWVQEMFIGYKHSQGGTNGVWQHPS